MVTCLRGRTSLYLLLGLLSVALVAPVAAQATPDQVLLARAHAAHDAGQHDLARALFAEVVDRYPATSAAPDANTMVAYYLAADDRFDEAAARFLAAAAHPAAAPEVAAEAALQAGAVCLWRYRADRAVTLDGQIQGLASHDQKLALLNLAAQRFLAVAETSLGRPGAVNAVAGAYAADQLGLLALLQGDPELAERWLRQGLTRAAEVPSALSVALRIRLAFALAQQAEWTHAVEVSRDLGLQAPTGTVLRHLTTDAGLPAQLAGLRAQIRYATGDVAGARAAVQACLSQAPLLHDSTFGRMALAQAQQLLRLLPMD